MQKKIISYYDFDKIDIRLGTIIEAKNYDDLKIHRPLNSYYKKQIANYAKREKLIWFEDRSNLELDYTRNKIRNFICSNELILKINRQRLLFSNITNIQSIHPNFFKKKTG